MRFFFFLISGVAVAFIVLSFRAAELRRSALTQPDLGIDFNYPRHFVTPQMEIETQAMKNRHPGEIEAVDELGHQVEVASANTLEPQFLLFIKDGCPCSIDAQPLFNRLGRKFATKVQFFGVIDGNRDHARAYAERYTCAFPVLADPDLKIVREFEAKGGVYSALLARNGHIVKLWPGYSAEILQEMNRFLSEASGVKLSAFDPQYAPTRKTAGCAFAATWAH